MDKPPFWVVFTAPVRLGALHFMPGQSAPVSEEELAELLAVGVAEPREGVQAEPPIGLSGAAVAADTPAAATAPGAAPRAATRRAAKG